MKYLAAVAAFNVPRPLVFQVALSLRRFGWRRLFRAALLAIAWALCFVPFLAVCIFGGIN